MMRNRCVSGRDRAAMSFPDANSTEARDALGNDPKEVAQTRPSLSAECRQSAECRAQNLDTQSQGSMYTLKYQCVKSTHSLQPARINSSGEGRG
jgi:hypothetical protein